MNSGSRIGPVAGTFLVATTMIGSGIYMLPATVAAIGSISIVGWVIAAIGAMLTGLTLAFLARVEPGGAFLDSIAQILGPFAGLVATILYFLSIVISLPMVAIAAAGYTAFLLPTVNSPGAMLWLSIACLWLFVGISWAGSGSVIARIGSLTLVIGLIPLLIVAILGWTHFDAGIFRESWNISGKSDASAAFSATLLLFMAYLGLENASLVSEQMQDPRRNVPIATVAGVAFATLVYVGSTTVVSGLIPAATLAKSAAPFADATVIILGSFAAMLVAVCGAAKAAGTLGALQLGTVESLIVLKRQFTGTAMSRAAANILVGLMATALALASSRPTIAGQFGLLATAMVAITILAFALAGLALAKARDGAPRIVGIATILFSLGLIAAQPAQDLISAAVLIVCTGAIAGLLLQLRRRSASRS